jgi:hypothetical protein
MIAVPAVLFLAVLVRRFWVELYVIWTILQVLFYTTGISFMTSLIWYVLFGDTSDMRGFWILWLFHGITVLAIAGVYFCIVLDLIGYGIAFIRNIFKIR